MNWKYVIIKVNLKKKEVAWDVGKKVGGTIMLIDLYYKMHKIYSPPINKIVKRKKISVNWEVVL